MSEIELKLPTAPSDPIQPKESVFVWIDILGFSDMIMKADAFDEPVRLRLLRLRRLFENDERFHSNIISDGMLLEIAEVHHRGDFRTLIDIFQIIGQKLIEFILETKCAVRGGISIGTRWTFGTRENDYVSNGLARAYHLESTKVDWPIVATTREFLMRLQAMFRVESSEEFDFSHAFNKSGDDIYFIDFLRPLTDVQMISRYSEFIFWAIDQNESKPNVRNKYVWLLKHLAKVKGTPLPVRWQHSII
ncbi:MAG: hypothetical protein ACOY5B_11570 [Spirochaetota bacterium]